DAPGLIGLGDELSAMTAAQPKQRRRTEDLRVPQAGAHLLERSGHRAGLRPADEDAYEMPEGRVAELTPALQLAGQEPQHVVSRRQLDRLRVRLAGLAQHGPGGIAAGPPGELRRELLCPLLGTDVRIGG